MSGKVSDGEFLMGTFDSLFVSLISSVFYLNLLEFLPKTWDKLDGKVSIGILSENFTQKPLEFVSKFEEFVKFDSKSVEFGNKFKEFLKFDLKSVKFLSKFKEFLKFYSKLVEFESKFEEFRKNYLKSVEFGSKFEEVLKFVVLKFFLAKISVKTIA